MKKIDYYNISKQKLQYLNYANNTIEIYLHYIKEFIEKNSNVSPSRYNSILFQNYLDSYTFTSNSQQNQIISSIKFLYENVLNKKYNKISFKRPNKEKKLPKVLDNTFILKKLSKINNLKHKTILSLTYSVGLRVSEIINLKVENIDSNRMIINIINSKGNKDRIVPLSNQILILLRKYYLQYKPVEYLFNGQNKSKYSSSSCNKIVKKYLGDKYYMHILRHSCFTFLLESGIDLRIIQKIAGHSSSKTTEIYTHVSKKLLSSISLPI